MQVTVSEDFVVYLIFLKKMTGYRPKSGHDRFPANPFHLIIHQLSYTIVG
jgi:hypothetical protein